MAAVQEEYPDVGGVPTYVLKCGGIRPSNVLVLIIPGNPGVAGYYEEFMTCLYSKSGCRLPVWCVSHAGHGNLPAPYNRAHPRELLCLKGQIQHKLLFIQDYIPKQTKLILIGHSIGCYMILHMLNVLDPGRVLKGIFLFPTVERMALSSSGQVATPALKYFRFLTPIPMYIVHYLFPSSIIEAVLRWYFKHRKVPDSAIHATKKLANPWSIKTVVNMANEEMQTVVEADYKIIANNLDKLWFYYGSKDHWCPVEYYEDMKAKFPEGDIQLCRNGFEHAFVLESSKGMAEIVWDWLKKNVPVCCNGL